VQPVLNVVLQALGQPIHELGPGCDYVFVKLALSLLEWLISELDLLRPLIEYLLLPGQLLLDLEGPAESSTSLLVHLGPGCHAVDGHVYEFPRLRDPHHLVHVLEDVVKHLCVDRGLRTAGGSRARVNDAVHV